MEAVQAGQRTAIGFPVDQSIPAGDAAAFDCAFRRLSDGLYRFAYRMTGSSEVASDTVQEAFAEAWRLSRTWDSEATLRAFVYCVARTRTLMHRRHAGVARRLAARTSVKLGINDGP